MTAQSISVHQGTRHGCGGGLKTVQDSPSTRRSVLLRDTFRRESWRRNPVRAASGQEPAKEGKEGMGRHGRNMLIMRTLAARRNGVVEGPVRLIDNLTTVGARNGAETRRRTILLLPRERVQPVSDLLVTVAAARGAGRLAPVPVVGSTSADTAPARGVLAG
jgi:hypothetical protein